MFGILGLVLLVILRQDVALDDRLAQLHWVDLRSSCSSVFQKYMSVGVITSETKADECWFHVGDEPRWLLRRCSACLIHACQAIHALVRIYDEDAIRVDQLLHLRLGPT